MMLEKVKKTQTYEIVVDRIKTEIEKGAWKPGTNLPSERILAEQLGVSRPSVREALRVLEVMGYVEIKPGQGTFAKEPDQNEKSSRLLLSMLDQDDNVLEVLEIREIFEPQIAYLAAESATDRDIKVMKEILQRMDDHMRKGESTVNDNIEFHLAIARTTNNKVLFQVQKILLKASKDAVTRYFEVPGRDNRSVIGHKQILTAIEDHDAESAKQFMFEHLRTRLSAPNGKFIEERETTI
jgi:GntR family transcriptional repressor for pyruvate dehydrogenase complex